MTYKVVAYHIERVIDLRKFRANCSFSILKREHSFLLYGVEKESFIYVKDYGSIVFFNCEREFIDNILLTVLEIKSSFEFSPKEEYIVEIDKIIEVDFGKIKIDELSEDVAHIIMLNLGQSVALKYYLNKTESLHESTLIYAKQMENKGNIKLSKKQMRIFIGKTMNLKNSIAENLFIFDSSDLAWSNQELSRLDYLIKDELDIVKRHHGLQFYLNVIKENLDLFNDILQHRYSSMLEWIIIILILFEVIQVIIEKI
jgi:uncharacterized Rmd1/YagE family protein